MKKIKELDKTIQTLNNLTYNGSYVTVEDIIQQTKIEKNLQIRILEYLNKCSYCERSSNAYKITFDGEFFLDKTILPFRNRPFLYEIVYKQIKFSALFLNTILVLALGILNYQINIQKVVDKRNEEVEKQNEVIDSIPTKNNSLIIKNDSINLKVNGNK